MGSSYLEIVELEDGTYALQKIDSSDEPLVVINFSDEVLGFLKENKVSVAKAMIGAGVQAVGSVSKAMGDLKEREEQNKTLH